MVKKKQPTKKKTTRTKYLKPDMKFSVGLQQYQPEVKLDNLIRKNNQMAKKAVKQKKPKQVKVFFCPKCKSTEVGFVLSWRNVFGVLPKMRCKKCGFKERAFPILCIDADKLNKMDSKIKKKPVRGKK